MYENVRISDQHWKDSLGSLTFKENKCHGLIESIGICFAHVFCKACWNEANSADFGSTKAKYTPTTSSKNQGKIRQLLSHKKKFIRKLEHLPRAFRSEAGAEGSLLQIRNLQLGLSQKKLQPEDGTQPSAVPIYLALVAPGLTMKKGVKFGVVELQQD